MIHTSVHTQYCSMLADNHLEGRDQGRDGKVETGTPDDSQSQRLQDRRRDDSALDKGVRCQGWHTSQAPHSAQHF